MLLFKRRRREGGTTKTLSAVFALMNAGEQILQLVGKGFRKSFSAGEMVAAPTAHWTS